MDYIKQLFLYAPDMPVYILGLLAIVGLYKVFLSGQGSFYKEELEGYMRMHSPEDDLFLKLGRDMTANKYKTILYAGCLAIFIIFGVYGISAGSIRAVLGALLFSLLIAFLFQPKKYLFGKTGRTLFYLLVELVSKSRAKELEEELYQSVSYLKNLSIAQKNRSLSADSVLESLGENSKKLKTVYAMTLQGYRQGDRQNSLRKLAAVIGTKSASTFTQILDKMDKVNPGEITLQIEALHETMTEERFTKGLEEAEGKGNILFVLTTICAFVCLINFLVATILTDALEMLGGLA